MCVYVRARAWRFFKFTVVPGQRPIWLALFNFLLQRYLKRAQQEQMCLEFTVLSQKD